MWRPSCQLWRDRLLSRECAAAIHKNPWLSSVYGTREEVWIISQVQELFRLKDGMQELSWSFGNYASVNLRQARLVDLVKRTSYVKSFGKDAKDSAHLHVVSYIFDLLTEQEFETVCLTRYLWLWGKGSPSRFIPVHTPEVTFKGERQAWHWAEDFMQLTSNSLWQVEVEPHVLSEVPTAFFEMSDVESTRA